MTVKDGDRIIETFREDIADDGKQPGDLYPEKTNEITTIIYQEDAASMYELLYGDVL